MTTVAQTGMVVDMLRETYKFLFGILGLLVMLWVIVGVGRFTYDMLMTNFTSIISQIDIQGYIDQVYEGEVYNPEVVEPAPAPIE